MFCFSTIRIYILSRVKSELILIIVGSVCVYCKVCVYYPISGVSLYVCKCVYGVNILYDACVCDVM